MAAPTRYDAVQRIVTIIADPVIFLDDPPVGRPDRRRSGARVETAVRPDEQAGFWIVRSVALPAISDRVSSRRRRARRIIAGGRGRRRVIGIIIGRGCVIIRRR